ncbi:chloride channel protein [Wenxinia marina]|uniref:Chloride channel protein EriC n=1 Tax=Wenxinia marina DSM 24838 TaxID=1123501 RepID=A0A0D0NJS5_9RHOB|nr:chloride channel protein [Wenxinia marina]KIQ68580.1 Chloride channel protein EriC [Wenxinia marina DSM 24838]GGL67019.1 chloride channel protein [Wenxinia marina]
MRQRINRAARTGWALMLTRGPSQAQFWVLALLLGIGAGGAAVLFRLGISWLQATIYGTPDILTLHTFAASLAWYWIVLIPVAGGLTVGLLVHHLTPDGRVRSVQEVIEGASLYDGRVERRAGLVSAFASLITLSTGGSSGREGPVVHLAAILSSYVAVFIRASGVTGRELLGCAVAAAVSASFNAPLAGALFALEVVLRHYAVHAFAPIAIASVAGAVISRLTFGDVQEFDLPVQSALGFYVELPAFLILGLICGAVAVVFMRAIFWVDDLGSSLQARLRLPGWLRPTVAGLLLGLIATQFPHVIGVGYETTNRALAAEYGFLLAVVFVAVKVAAVAITIGGRMGGGVFSPSLMVGALTGLAFGSVATAIFPDVSGEGSLYALSGLGAVSASVLGAPISTTLIVFELTGDWQAAVAVMAAVSTSVAVSTRLVHRSFFLTSLERRGIHLAAGPQAWLLGTLKVEEEMRRTEHPRAAPTDACSKLVADGTYLRLGATLEAAMPLFEATGAPFIPVVRFPGGDTPPELLGALFQTDALKALNEALVEMAEEEHA